MKIMVIALILGTFFLNGCGNKSNDEAQDKGMKKDTLIESVKPLLPDGPYVEKYPEGQIKIEGEIKNGTRYGQWKSYYPNGTKQSEDYFEDGKKNGKTATFYKNGRIRYIGYFTWDKMSGNWEFYDTLGNVASKKEYK